MNAILNTERAIVTEFEGTTRDTIEEFIQIDGIPVKLIDTAGIHKTDDFIEKIGIDKSMKAVQNADLVIAIIDASKDLEEEDKEILERLKDKKCIILLNKIDKSTVVNKEMVEKIVQDKEIIQISALNKTGINLIYNAISKMYNLNEIGIDDSLTITNERHKKAIIEMKENIRKAKESIKENLPIDIITINITGILENISEITGEGVSEDIITEIFKKFCLGK